ncbi:hypothetical protein ALC60_13274 [Trachymyrmex zeteki]|uniref:Uncharacterized protein n=1 Tax=Mycetomoellerius zeteki TaxID=64791 RepID=A0A151WIM2_9HYME|nr:hypothetical protein ALC60_13274 [Trachymyrmex zeteki]
MFVAEHRSLVAKINSVHNVNVYGFLTAQDRFQKFLSQRTIACLQLFLPLGCLKQVSNGCYERFIDFEYFFDGGACEYSYDKSCGSTISDISFKVDGTVFDRFNIDFTGVEAHIELSCEALGRFRFGFGSSSEKNVSFLIGSLEDSIVFSTICFSGSIIGLKIVANVIERLVKSRDKRVSFRTAAGVAKAVNEPSKAAQHQLQELQRHNRVMEGRGVYLAPYKRGRGVARRKKKRLRDVKTTKGCNYQRATAATCKSYAHFIF